MMHGYGYGMGDWMTPSSSLLNGTGWMVISMMGIGFLLIIGVVVWLAWSQRQALGLGGPGQVGQPYTMGNNTSIMPAVGSQVETVEQVARRRYANGEIDAEEYRTIMATLRGEM